MTYFSINFSELFSKISRNFKKNFKKLSRNSKVLQNYHESFLKYIEKILDKKIKKNLQYSNNFQENLLIKLSKFKKI